MNCPSYGVVQRVVAIHVKLPDDMLSLQKTPHTMGSIMWSFCILHIAGGVYAKNP